MPASEFDVGHIRLARETDLVVVAPATADLMAKMAGGHADDLATAVLLATGAKILLAPAMNPHMWAQQGDAAQSRAACRRRRRAGRPERRRDGGSGRTRRSAAWPSRWRSPPRWRNCSRAQRAQPLAGQARAGHLRPDARADRSGALYRQPLLRQAGPRHCRGGGARRRRGDAGERAGESARSAGRDRRACRKRARDAARGRARAARRCRDFRRRGRRLARRQCRRTEDQEEGRPGDAGIVADGKPRHPVDHRAPQDRSGRSW